MTIGGGSWSYPHDVSSAGEARADVRRFASQMGLADGTTDMAALAVSELVGNALVHATDPRPIRVAATVTEHGALRIEVCDQNAEPPALLPQTAPPGRRGRGLLIIDSVCERWGWEPIGEGGTEGKLVWCELRPEPSA